MISVRLPKIASASPKNRTTPLCTAASKTYRRFFSVSPMYLLMTLVRSFRKRSRFKWFPITSAAMVLHVPLGPEKSAVIPYISRIPAVFAFIGYPL